MQILNHKNKFLTFWCPLPGSSGCAVAPPTAGLPQCRRWKRQKSRGEGHFPAWAGCPTAVSPRSACLHSGTQKWKAPSEILIFTITTNMHLHTWMSTHMIDGWIWHVVHQMPPGYQTPWQPLLILWAWNPQLHPHSQYNYKGWQHWKWQFDVISSSGIWTQSFPVASII